MKNEILKQIIKQIKKYELTNFFSDEVEFKNWASKLNKVQINNFLNLDIELEEVKKIRKILINSDLLNCSDYIKRVEVMSTLKNINDSSTLIEELCKPNFLHSKNFYNDIEMLSKAHALEPCLQIIAKDAFINSPYHNEDLKLIIETKDTNKEETFDFIVSSTLATVASNIDSINSKYHQEDMKLIATVGSNCLQLTGVYPECSINYLAIDKVSLSDKYHLENMKILATTPIAAEFLYILMTNPNVIKGKYYRKEIEALVNAKSRATARALYYYILNPYRKYLSDIDFLNDSYYDITDASIFSNNAVKGSEDPDYLINLKKINEINDKFVYHYVSLLMNPNFINGKYKNFDLELLQSVSNKAIFMDLYYFMCNKVALLNSQHHQTDAIMISKSNVDGIRDLLLKKACNEYSINTKNHRQDMELISKLQLDKIKEKIYFELYYYLFKNKGMDDPKRQEKIEKLLQGELVERNNSISNYLDELELELEKSEDTEIVKSVSDEVKTKTRILSIFKKYRK